MLYTHGHRRQGLCTRSQMFVHIVIAAQCQARTQYKTWRPLCPRSYMCAHSHGSETRRHSRPYPLTHQNTAVHTHVHTHPGTHCRSHRRMHTENTVTDIHAHTLPDTQTHEHARHTHSDPPRLPSHTHNRTGRTGP